MKKAALLLIVFVFAFAAVSFAGEGCKSSSAKNGWQTVYDDMASWSWSGCGPSKGENKEKMACGCPEGKCTCKK